MRKNITAITTFILVLLLAVAVMALFLITADIGEQVSGISEQLIVMNEVNEQRYEELLGRIETLEEAVNR